MALIFFNFAYCFWRINGKGDKRNGRDGRGRGVGQGGKGKEEGEVLWLVLNWLGYELVKTFSCIACVVHGAMVLNCLWDTSALVPNCLRSEVSWVRSVRTPTQLNEPPTKWVAYKGKEAESLFVSRFLKWQSSFLLKISTLLQRNNAAGRLFHTSTILTEKKYPLVRMSKWTCGLGYFKFMTAQLCTRHSKEITVLDIIETLKKF